MGRALRAPTIPAEPTWDDIARVLDGGARADVAVAGAGGRWVVGSLLTRRTAAQLMPEGKTTDRAAELGAVWVHPKPHAAHFTWADQLGFRIEAPRQAEPQLNASVAAMADFDWHVRPGEDLLAHSYWRQHRSGGSLAVEVPMPDDGSRKMDGVIVGDGRGCVVGRGVHWDGIDDEVDVTVVEAKQIPRASTKGGANDIEMVIGQVAAARAGVAWRLGRPLERVRAVALTGKPAPAALSQLGERLGIEVVGVQPSSLLQVPLAPGDPVAERITRLAAEEGCSPSEAVRRLLEASEA